MIRQISALLALLVLLGALIALSIWVIFCLALWFYAEHIPRTWADFFPIPLFR